MSNKITIRELAPYLPYMLEIVTPHCEGYADVMIGLRYNKFNEECVIDRDRRSWKVVQIQPMLRPLSDLTKSITVKGETFVPTDSICEILGESKYKHLGYGMYGFSDKYGNMTIIQYGDEFVPDGCTVIIYDQLLSWHFDVFNLIPQGLALPITE